MFDIVVEEHEEFQVKWEELLCMIEEYNGGWKFSNSGLNVAGFNPLLKVYYDRYEFNGKSFSIENPFVFLDEIIKSNNIINLDIGFLGYISYDFKDFFSKSFSYKNGDIEPFYFALYSDYYVFSQTDFIVKHYSLYIDGLKFENIKRKFCDIKISDKKSVLVNDYYPKSDFINGVENVVEEIKKGNVYQLNLTRAIDVETEKGLLEVANNLLRSNNIEHGFFMKIGEFFIISTSPERFFRLKDGIITTSPIKGTVSSKCSIDKLLEDKKEMAELSMIVDLLRNDMSGVCVPGSVEVDEFPKFLFLENVIHMYGDINGKILPDIGIYDIIKTMFPGGSISGCPKVSACKYIEGFEPVKRGVYTGSAGIYSFNGDMDFNILIRTVIYRNKKITFNVGGGITILSNSGDEFFESVIKVKNITSALNMEDIN